MKLTHYNCRCLECLPAKVNQLVKVRVNRRRNAIAPISAHTPNIGQIYHRTRTGYYKVEFELGVHFLFKANELERI